MAVPFAFSVHHFINTVGSDAGFASIIGLAILVLLYFSQARESANLREQANESAQRVAELEARVAQLVRSQSAGLATAVGAPVAARALANPVPSAAVPGAAVPAAGVSAAGSRAAPIQLAPAAPAGVGAPALAAATRVVPAGLMKAVPAGGNGGPVVNAPPPEAPSGAVATQPPPATAAGAANGATATRPPGAVQQPPGAHRPPASPQPVPAGPPRRVQIAPGGPGAMSRPPLVPPPEPPRSRAMRFVWAGLAVVAVGVAVAAVLILTNSPGGASKAANNGSHTTNALLPGGGRPFNPGSITVAVLNGTTIPGGAHKVALQLGAAGYRQGTIATASDQTRTATVVAFSPGHRFAATKVAGLLRLGPASVQPVDPATLAVACPPPAACTAQVVVTLGKDLASSQ